MALSSNGAPTADSTRTPTPTWCATCLRRALRSALRAGACPDGDGFGSFWLKRRPLAASVGGRLIGGADAKQKVLAERPAHELHRLWQAVAAKADRHREAGQAEIVDRTRVGDDLREHSRHRRGPADISFGGRRYRPFQHRDVQHVAL